MNGLGLIAQDPRVLDDVRRLAAIAGAEVDAAVDHADIRRCWRTARMVVVELAAAERVLSLEPARRDGVVLIAEDVDRVETWQVATRLGAQRVLTLVRDEQVLLDLMATAADPSEGPPGVVVGVLPGSGGAGASTLSVATALQATASGAVTLVDADPAGGGLDLLLGAERVEGLRWPDLADVRGVVASRALDEALPRAAGLRVLSHASGSDARVTPEAMTAVLSAARRHAATVVVDLPRGGADAATAASACDVIVLVALAEVRAVAAAASALRAADAAGADVRLVVRVPARSRLRPPQVGAALGRPVDATIPYVGEVPAAADRGDLARVLGRSAFRSAAERVLSMSTEARPAVAAMSW